MPICVSFSFSQAKERKRVMLKSNNAPTTTP